MKWYIFDAIKNGEMMREKIPAETKKKAITELERLGYTEIKIERWYNG